ncbi:MULTISPECIES: DNA internalization-related competence protein ComEC/Rec2 [Tenebrionibacter/Tenebrionicola group]|jgi:competence protein ComEC|uniref:DNA internalization-related competence protein ComEC/Rec2 n=2 Tax=Tenebrionibacter/Tenebrionicola group TaxID=2969848 RepID=A0A8K0XWP1_9ENTR|nr:MULTISPECIES: DNA internalization-related competence protein ComEC/Rec2 [Tenebrionibacter/Tenebrionicola group]MBK4714753.1 DNA internalization-related competence protein ComEC/Rec2 [Tenebrionibacter intestinalis]MBV5095498.1 DNA internalization-related competence protein ComEC/Rec2 [Tenebrionicola larvae]
MVSLTGLCLCVIVGIAPLMWLAEIPSLEAISGLMGIAALVSVPAKRTWRYGALVLWMLCWGLLAARQALWPVEALADHTLDTEVIITGATNEKVNALRITRIGKRWLFPAPGVRVYDAALSQPACSGQRWHMRLRLRPVHGKLNAGGFDAQRYALAMGVTLRARILSAAPIATQCDLRSRFIQRFTRQSRMLAWQEVLLALGFGERAGLSQHDRDLLRATGTAHLMAISGLHIGLSGTLGWGLMRLLQLLFPARLIGWRLPLWGGLLAAGAYTWLAGAQPPAVRTFLSMLVCGALRLSGIRTSGWRLWLICVAVMIFAEPLALLSDSFLLSVSAVAGLLFWYQWLPLASKPWPAFARHVLSLAHLQAGMMFLLLPMQLAIFHGVSLSNWPANLVAVPAVTFITVPLILLAMLLTGFSQTAGLLLTLADRSLDAVFAYLRWLPDGWLALDERYLWLSFAPWPALILWRFRSGLAWSGVALATVAALLHPFWREKNSQGWALHVLDIGHGLAVVVERRQQAMLYDSGNAWQGGDSGQQTIAPWLRWHRLTPQGLILSHEHLDHSGGVASLLAAWPHMLFMRTGEEAGHYPCWQGMRWRWQGLTFTVHWPPRGRQGSGNNHSCVVKIDDGRHSVLLTGDIEAAAELEMVRSERERLRADVLQVPHHGSRTSSSPLLLSQVSPAIAVASVARYSAWRLPSAVVLRRYRERRIVWYDTARHGQITLRFGAGQPQVLSFREHISPRWYHQWFGVTPVNR